MRLPRYGEYKESGVAWLGVVPGHWTVKKLGRQFLRPPCYGVLVPDFEVDGVPMIRIMDIQHGKVNRNELTTISRELSNQYTRTLIEKGDVLLSVVGTIGEVVHVDDHLAGVNLSRAIARLRADEAKLNPRFLGWLLQSSIFSMYVDLICVGSAQRVLNMGDLSGFLAGIPTAAEQAAIAVFLERETGKIDALIAEQEKLIALAIEKREATISHAVTRGLDPDSPMKGSGVAWLGELPAHWQVGALKRFWSVTDCKHITADFTDDGYPLASIREVQSRYVALENAKRTTAHFYEQLIEGGRKPMPGDLVFSRNATVGEVAQVSCDHPPFAMGQDVCLLRKARPEFSSDYLQAVIRCGVVTEQLKNLMIGSTFKRVNVEEIRGLTIPMPPPPEQAAIARFIEGETAKLDELQIAAEGAISLLNERRGALIAAAVTGQVDVRNALGVEDLHPDSDGRICAIA